MLILVPCFDNHMRIHLHITTHTIDYAGPFFVAHTGNKYLLIYRQYVSSRALYSIGYTHIYQLRDYVQISILYIYVYETIGQFFF